MAGKVYVRDVYLLPNGKLDYFAPLPPSRRHQGRWRGEPLYRLRIRVKGSPS